MKRLLAFVTHSSTGVFKFVFRWSDARLNSCWNTHYGHLIQLTVNWVIATSIRIYNSRRDIISKVTFFLKALENRDSYNSKVNCSNKNRKEKFCYEFYYSLKVNRCNVFEYILYLCSFSLQMTLSALLFIILQCSSVSSVQSFFHRNLFIIFSGRMKTMLCLSLSEHLGNILRSVGVIYPDVLE